MDSLTKMMLAVVAVSLLVMTLGFAARATKGGVVAMLVGISGVLGSVAYYIANAY
jgi:hypothetical protein